MTSSSKDHSGRSGAAAGPNGQRHEALKKDLQDELENEVPEEFEHPTFPEGAKARGKDADGLDEDPIYGAGEGSKD
ncbi:hypothetical protein ACFQXB_11130 [Plastorhodobacter daqingensis]|uniref:Uncharacterized protein n=1 Tax=Plastorhodobacter daqingensis TaxID=1387281 RepID=A0ABW2ULA1_9RHOB